MCQLRDFSEPKGDFVAKAICGDGRQRRAKVFPELASQVSLDDPRGAPTNHTRIYRYLAGLARQLSVVTSIPLLDFVIAGALILLAIGSA